MMKNLNILYILCLLCMSVMQGASQRTSQSVVKRHWKKAVILTSAVAGAMVLYCTIFVLRHVWWLKYKKGWEIKDRPGFLLACATIGGYFSRAYGIYDPVFKYTPFLKRITNFLFRNPYLTHMWSIGLSDARFFVYKRHQDVYWVKIWDELKGSYDLTLHAMRNDYYPKWDTGKQLRYIGDSPNSTWHHK